METIGVVFLICNIFYKTKFFCIQTTETVGQTFRRCRINREVVIILVRPFFYTAFHFTNNVYCKFLGFWIMFPLTTIKDSRYFIQANIAERNRSSTMFKELIHLIIFAKTFSKSTVLIKNRSIGWCCFFCTFHTIDKGIFSDVHPFIEDFPEFIHITFRFEGNSWKVDSYNPKIHTTRIDFLTIFIFPTL